MSEVNKSLEEKVVKWLRTEGYRLEYHTLKAFRDTGLTAFLGNYVPTDEGTPREIDVTSYLTGRNQNNHFLAARWLCECKYSGGKPWILLDADGTLPLDEMWHATPQSKRLYNSNILTHKEMLSGSWHFDPSRGLAHSVLQAKIKPEKDQAEDQPTEEKKRNRDFAYESLHKIAHAAWEYADLDEKNGAALVVVIPCIVIDGPLLLAKFNHDTNDFEASRVPSGRIWWLGCREGTLVDVVHISEVQKYAVQVKDTFEKLMGMLNQSF
jgi:hypothetical protein